MSFDEIFDLTAGVYFYFHNIFNGATQMRNYQALNAVVSLRVAIICLAPTAVAVGHTVVRRVAPSFNFKPVFGLGIELTKKNSCTPTA